MVRRTLFPAGILALLCGALLFWPRRDGAGSHCAREGSAFSTQPRWQAGRRSTESGLHESRGRAPAALRATATATATADPLVSPVEVADGPQFVEWHDKYWFPVASTFELDEKRPTPVTIDGLALVVWFAPNASEAGEWRVFADVCPHRLAPLSEGRIDANGNLQCAYHGWEFGDSGACSRIPQAAVEKESALLAAKRSGCRSYPTKVAAGLIWAWFGASEPKGEPMDNMGPFLKDEVTAMTYTRDMPYGYGALMENLFDASHVPFAHHGLQGTRDDAITITSQVRRSDDQGWEIDVQDRTMGMHRNVTSYFFAPFWNVYRGQFLGKNRTFALNIVCIPVRPGWSRIITVNTKSVTDTAGRKKLLGRIPPWFVHAKFVNRFMDSDLAFLHYQEKALLRRMDVPWQKAYYMPTEADRSIVEWRRWLDKHGPPGAGGEPPREPLAREQLLNRWEQHSKHCKHCRAAAEGMEKWQGRLLKASLGLGPFLWPWLPGRLLCAAGLAGYFAIKSLRQQMVYQDYEHWKK